jgi:hypothetical protein
MSFTHQGILDLNRISRKKCFNHKFELKRDVKSVFGDTGSLISALITEKNVCTKCGHVDDLTFDRIDYDDRGEVIDRMRDENDEHIMSYSVEPESSQEDMVIE